MALTLALALMYFLMTAEPVAVDQAFAVNKHQQYLLGPACMDLCLYKAWLPLFDPLHRLSLGLRSVVAHHGLIHGHNVLQHRHDQF
jgi:hypothetical protein